MNEFYNILQTTTDRLTEENNSIDDFNQYAVLGYLDFASDFFDIWRLMLTGRDTTIPLLNSLMFRQQLFQDVNNKTDTKTFTENI